MRYVKESKCINPVLETKVLTLNTRKVIRGVLHPVLEEGVDNSAYVMLSGAPENYFDDKSKDYYRALFHFGGGGFTPYVGNDKEPYKLRGIFIILVPEYGEERQSPQIKEETDINHYFSSSYAEGEKHWGSKDCIWKLKYADKLVGESVYELEDNNKRYLGHSTETNTTYYLDQTTMVPKDNVRHPNYGDPDEHDAFGIDALRPSNGRGSFAEAVIWHVEEQVKERFRKPN